MATATLAAQHRAANDNSNPTPPTAHAHACIIASFGQAKALRDMPRHLKASAL